MRMCFVHGNGYLEALRVEMAKKHPDVLVLLSGFYYSQAMANLQMAADAMHVSIDLVLGQQSEETKRDLISSLEEKFSDWWKFIGEIRSEGVKVFILNDRLEIYTKDHSTFPVIKDRVFTLSGRLSSKTSRSKICGRILYPKGVFFMSEISTFFREEESTIVFWPRTAYYQDSLRGITNNFVVITDKVLSRTEADQLATSSVVFSTKEQSYIEATEIRRGLSFINL